VRSCDLYWLGAGGVWLAGGNAESSPRVPAGHRVINNHIHHFGQIERVYAAGVNSGYINGEKSYPAVGMLVANNLIHDAPHAGVLTDSFDSVFEYNEIFAFARTSNDIGGFYSFATYPWQGNLTYRYNLIHSSADGDGIYFDYDHRDMQVYGNIIYLKSIGRRGIGYLYKEGTQIKNPQTIDCRNNIAISSNVGFQLAPGPGSTIENNVTVMCRNPYKWVNVKGEPLKVPTEGMESGKNVTYASDPGFVNMERLDFRLKPDSKILKDLPGFKPIPVEKIGLYVDEYRHKLPTDEEVGRFRGTAREAVSTYEILDRN
jgi:hypothetical protein